MKLEFGQDCWRIPGTIQVEGRLKRTANSVAAEISLKQGCDWAFCMWWSIQPIPARHSLCLTCRMRRGAGVPKHSAPAKATQPGVDGVKAGRGRLGTGQLEHSYAWCIFHCPDVPQLTRAVRRWMRQSQRVFWPLGSAKEAQACPASRRHKGILKLWSSLLPLGPHAKFSCGAGTQLWHKIRFVH